MFPFSFSGPEMYQFEPLNLWKHFININPWTFINTKLKSFVKWNSHFISLIIHYLPLRFGFTKKKMWVKHFLISKVADAKIKIVFR